MADFGIGEAAVAEGAKSAGEAAAVTGGSEAASAAALDASVAGSGVLTGSEVAAGGAVAGAGTAAGTAAASGGLLGGLGDAAAKAAISAGITKLATPRPPGPTKPTPMPDMNSPEAQMARSRSIAEQMARRGRASTLLTQPSNTLGG